MQINMQNQIGSGDIAYYTDAWANLQSRTSNVAENGPEHKPGALLGKASSAGPEDLAVFTFGAGADASICTDICARAAAAPWQHFF